jgi:ribosomal protein S18 acetylase RimI-like enzyme
MHGRRTRRTPVNLRIRPVRDDDIDALAELSLLAWTPVFASFKQILGPDIYPIIYPDWRKMQKDLVEGVCRDGDETPVWVAEVDGTVAGFVAYKLRSKDDGGEGEVYLLAVHPEYQNQGIGTELNLFALEKMRESGMKLAVVGTGGDPSHAPARRSYEKAGYTALPLVRYYKALT